MFTKQLEHIITIEALKDVYKSINKKATGLDEVDFVSFEEDFNTHIKELYNSILEGSYAPEPLKKIEIDKPSSNEKRPIALSSIKDKIIQRVLYDELNPYFEDTFSDKSYAYRPNKSTLKAINRVTHFLNQHHHWIVKTDIDNFFETINHDILIEILSNHIADNRIIKLLTLFLYSFSSSKK